EHSRLAGFPVTTVPSPDRDRSHDRVFGLMAADGGRDGKVFVGGSLVLCGGCARGRDRAARAVAGHRLCLRGRSFLPLRRVWLRAQGRPVAALRGKFLKLSGGYEASRSSPRERLTCP